MSHQEHAKQPGSRMCFVCGVMNTAGLQIEFFNDGPDACHATVTLDDRFQGYPGVVHGGIVATMLDETSSRSVLAGNPDRLMFTAKLEVRYRQPVPTNRPLTLRGRVEKDRGRLVMVSGDVSLEDGTILAEANVTLMAIPPEELGKMDSERVGWKVYP